MPFDFKKEYKEFYLPPRTPQVVKVPAMRFVAVQGSGDPNDEGGAYQDALQKLYAVAYTLKMAPKAGREIAGYFAYVVPPLEGFWWQEGTCGVDYKRKQDFEWLSCVRVPDFVSQEDFDWAIGETMRKKKLDLADVQFTEIAEGLCVQCLHVGPYDDEPTTITAMDAFAAEQGLTPDFSETRRHHEIYLSDARRTAPEKLRTVIRHPVR